MGSGTALVTGATGLIGWHIVDRLLADGWQVRALVRSRESAVELEARGVESRVGNVLDRQSFVNAAEGCEAIFHCAAVIRSSDTWEDYRRVNVDGTQNAIAAAESSGARLMHMSSVAVYGGRSRYRGGALTTDEETPLAPPSERSFYARSKRESEELVMAAHRAHRIWATAVRPCVVYGTHDRQFTPAIAKALRFGYAPVIAGGRSTLAIVHAANVADGALLAVLSSLAGGRAYNLTNDSPVTAAAFLRLASEGLGRRIRVVDIPYGFASALMRTSRAAAWLMTFGRSQGIPAVALDFVSRSNPFSSDRARRELGWSPSVHPEEGIPEAFRWWMRHH